MSRFAAIRTLGAMLGAVPLLAHGQAQGNDERRERNERHPEIRQAIGSLERAKRHLQEAAHDFGGHRADALRACDTAIEQLKLALQFDAR